MTNVNNVVVMGNLVRDCGATERDFGYTSNGQARANVTIANNRSRKQGDEWVNDTSYFDVVIWGKTAENLKPYLIKGAKICVQGHLKQDRWEKDGQKQSRITIVAENIELCGGARAENTNNNNQQKFEPINNNPGFKEDIPYSNEPGDIPF